MTGTAMNEPSSAHSLCESTDTKAAKKTTFSTNTNYIEIIFLSYHPPTTDSEQQDLRFQPCLSLGCWDGESLFSWPGGTAITRSLWTWWCGVSTGKSYCWWFRSPKQPPFGCIKPCKKCDIYHINWWSPDFWTINRMDMTYFLFK